MKKFLLGALSIVLISGGLYADGLYRTPSKEELAQKGGKKKISPLAKKNYRMCKKKCEQQLEARALKGIYPDEDDFADIVDICSEECAVQLRDDIQKERALGVVAEPESRDERKEDATDQLWDAMHDVEAVENF